MSFLSRDNRIEDCTRKHTGVERLFSNFAFLLKKGEIMKALPFLIQQRSRWSATCFLLLTFF